jgi:hypothetical protein
MVLEGIYQKHKENNFMLALGSTLSKKATT